MIKKMRVVTSIRVMITPERTMSQHPMEIQRAGLIRRLQYNLPTGVLSVRTAFILSEYRTAYTQNEFDKRRRKW